MARSSAMWTSSVSLGGVISTAKQPLIRSPLAHVLPARAFFDLAKGPRIDGLISWGGSRAGFGVNLNETEMEEFIAPYRHLPIINYEGIIKGIPAVLTDTYRGMCDLIAHMIEVHRRRRFGHIRTRYGGMAFLSILRLSCMRPIGAKQSALKRCTP